MGCHSRVPDRSIDHNGWVNIWSIDHNGWVNIWSIDHNGLVNIWSTDHNGWVNIWSFDCIYMRRWATLHAGHHSRAQLPRPRGAEHRLHQPQLEILLRRGPAGVHRDARAVHRGVAAVAVLLGEAVQIDLIEPTL